MFGTWKYGRGEGQVESLKISHDYETARSNQHQACNRCHEKKLKCSGEREGCDRCAAQGLACEYSRSSSRSQKKSRRSEVPSSCSSRSGRETSGSPKSSNKPHSHSHSSKSKKDRRGSHHSGSSRAESLVASGQIYDSGSGDTSYGMGAFDSYGGIASTAASHASAYHSTAPIDGFPAGGDFDQGNWMLDVATSSGGMSSSFMATSESMYGNDATAYGNYPGQAGYDMYSNVDPRYWDQSQNQD